MEHHKSKKKIYGFIEKNSHLELESLRKEALSIQNDLNENQEAIDRKKEKISIVLDKMHSETKENLLDIGLFDQHRQYLSLLQDELIRDELISKSLSKRHSVQMAKVKNKYQQSKLYEKMIDKNDVEIKKILLKQEEKEIEELAVNSKSRGISYE